jgi:hypothetical protein
MQMGFAQGIFCASILCMHFLIDLPVIEYWSWNFAQKNWPESGWQ